MLAGGTSRTPQKADFFITDKIEELFERADILIDFTTPEASVRHAKTAAQTGKKLVIGTTGLDAAQQAELAAAAQETPLVFAANMSVGVTLLQALVRQVAARLGPEFDIEILETHHKYKQDAPSGTALLLGAAAQEGRQGAAFAAIDRTGARASGEIGYAVQRGGDVVGEHDVTFFGPGERLILAHKATDRALFARGAVRAALWLRDKEPGLYDMGDVLGL